MGGNEFPKSKKFKILRKVFPKMTFLRIITVTKYDLVSKMVFVMSKFFFDIRKLGVEFIILINFGFV